MDYRVAAEILLRTLEDLGLSDLSARPSRKGRMYESVLDERLQPEPERLDEMLASRGLSPRPAVLLVLEGETEMLLMPRVLAEIYGNPVPPTLVELVDMKTIDRDLDLLVRHEARPQARRQPDQRCCPPHEAAIADPCSVDPEKKYADGASVQRQRDLLVRRLHEALPVGMRSAAAMRQLRHLVQVVTWVTVPWEFANFSNTQLERQEH
jgi:hypothetical protein